MHFHNRLSRFTVALAFLASLFSVGADKVAAAGSCTLATHTYTHIYVEKYASAIPDASVYFDMVRGDATVRDLDICVGSTAGQGGSFVLPANIQDDTNGPIIQLGYGKWAGRSDLFFVYQLKGQEAKEWYPGHNFKPIVGDRIRFTITKGYLSGNVVTTYIINNLTRGTNDSMTVAGWLVSPQHAWWGYETWDSYSRHGHVAGQPAINAAYLGYSGDANTTIYYRSGMTSSDVKNTSGQSNHHGHLINWVYGSDGLDAETH